MIKEIVEFMDKNIGIEKYFLKDVLKEVYVVNNKNDTFLASIDTKSKQHKLNKIQDNNLSILSGKELEKIIFLENNSKALPRKQLNKDKGVGGAGVFLFSLYYELQEGRVVFFRKKEDVSLKQIDWKKKLISSSQGIQNQLNSALTYSQNSHLKKMLKLIEQKSVSLIKDNIKNIEYAMDEKIIPEKGNIKLAFLVSDRAITIFRESYLQRKVFLYDVENNKNKFTKGECSVCSQYSEILSTPSFLANYGVDFSSKLELGMEFNQLVCDKCSMKLEKFRYMTENKLTNPFPLFLDNKNLFSKQIVVLSDGEKKKSYREIVKSIYFTNSKDLKNYYLINYQSTLSSGTWKLLIKDLDYIENFQYMTSIKLENFLEIKHGFVLSDFYDKPLSVFQFEKIINNLIFDRKLQNYYFKSIKKSKKDTDGFMVYYKKYNKSQDRLEDSQNKNTLLLNYIIKYRQNFYDFIYKSDISALKFINFREMLLDIMIDNLKHDAVNKNGYSIYENEIKEKLNLLFSLNQKKETKLDSGEFIELKRRLQKSLGYWQESKDEDGNIIFKENKKPKKEFVEGKEYIEDDDKLFAFLCGQLARFLIGKRKGKDENKSHADFSYFTEWQTSKLLKEYMWEIHQKYAHELKFYKQYDNAMSMVMTYSDDVEIENIMEYMIAGYFSNNQLKYQDKIEENENE